MALLWLRIIALLGLLVLAAPPTARADDAIVDTHLTRQQVVSGGEGSLAWVTRPPGGGLHLRALGPNGEARDLPLPQFSRIDSADVGRGSGGRPTVVYQACRARCSVHTLDLVRGLGRPIAMPRPAPGCRFVRPVIDVTLFIRQSGPARRCRRGIYELHRGRLSRRQAGRKIGHYDLQGRRLAFERVTSSLWTQVVVRRLASRRVRVVRQSDLLDWDVVSIRFMPSWQGRNLWIGGWIEWPDSPHQAWVERRTIGQRIACRRDARAFQQSYTPHIEAPEVWAFAHGMVYYTLDGPGGLELRRRTDPPVSLVPCS